jgi:hypothetical protein
MPKFTGDKEWRVEDVAPNVDNPLPGVWVRAWRGGEPVESGPSWRCATAEQDAAARAAAAEICAARNAREARAASAPTEG